jgi:invasion protein IalB
MKNRSSFVTLGAAALLAVFAAVSFSAGAFAETKDKAKAKDKGAEKAGEQQVQQAVAIPSPWTKICNKDPQAGNKEICLTAQDIRAETGQFLASVAVREVEGDPKKQFIIAVPPGMQLQPGMRVVIDQNQPMPARYTICFPNACYGDMDVDKGFVDGMKKGQALTVQTINQVGRTVNFTLVLKDFAKSYDGPPVDPKVLEAQRQKLQDELQKKAEEARAKLLEGQKK